jgi:hypothetical protein
MAYDFTVFNRVACVHHRNVPEVEDLDILVDELARQHARIGKPLVFIAIIPEHVDVPSGMQRAALARFGERATPYVESSHLVFEGEGFKHSVQRSVVTALYTLKGGKVKVHIHKSLHAAALVIAPMIGKPALAIIQALRPKEQA